MLTVMRDMGLPMPVGAVLISPWVDLTHSFPSVMGNTPYVSGSSFFICYQVKNY
jgi:acetyl esterase/lipase